VDEAQNLTPRAVEELRMLSNFQLEEHALLQSFLIGQPEFRAIMQGAEMQQLRQRVIASYHLGPLDSEETRAYVLHRLGHVGWKDDPMFDGDAFNVIYGHSGGIPRRINTLCDRVMLAAFLGEQHRISGADISAVIDEIRDEQLQNDRPVGVASDVTPGLSETEGMSGTGGRFVVAPEVAREIGELAAGFDLSRMEVRVARLEESVAAITRLMNHLVRVSEQDSSGGAARHGH
jgi:hypothetical protein